jgi:NADP-dependent 3-hydroxy acid dehydrogenase YdfG
MFSSLFLRAIAFCLATFTKGRLIMQPHNRRSSPGKAHDDGLIHRGRDLTFYKSLHNHGKGENQMSTDEPIGNSTNQRLSGKTAVVTGASSGIGRATALTLAQAGAAVAVQARREDRLNQLVEEIVSGGGKAMAVAGDASDPADIDRLLTQTLAWQDAGGKYDIVVVNAGRGLAGGILDSDESQWRALYEINVFGAACLMRRAGRYFVERKGGDIVAVSSVVASKFALSAIAEGLRREICSHGVRLSVVMPGVVTSGFQQVAGYDQANFGKAVARFGQILAPQDIANGIIWLLTLPPHVNVNEIMIRPTGQNYP